MSDAVSKKPFGPTSALIRSIAAEDAVLSIVAAMGDR
jgi:hypothetical protein